MNGKDLLDIMEQVDDDLILESEAAPVVKKHQRWIAPAAGIAATVIALAGIVFLIKLTGSKETENTYMTTGPDITTTTEITTTPSEITTTPPDMTTAIPGWIKYCPDDSGMIHDTREVPAGEIEMPAVLKDEIGNPENSHQCFAVQIEISNLR